MGDEGLHLNSELDGFLGGGGVGIKVPEDVLYS